MLYLIRAGRPSGHRRDAALAGLFMVLQAYAELTHASFLLTFAALVALWTMIRGQVSGVRSQGSEVRGQGATVGGRWSALGRLAVAGVLFALGMAPILANMLPDLAAEGDFFTSGGGFADIFSADLVGYALPTQLHPVFGDLTARLSNHSAPRADGSQFAVNKGQQIYVGYVALILIAAGLWHGVTKRRRSDRWGSQLVAEGCCDVGQRSPRPWAANTKDGANDKPLAATSVAPRPDVWFWALSACLFFLLTLGPHLRVNGHDTGIPLPFGLIAQLPFFKGNRYPSRYSVMLLASLAPLVACGVWHSAYCVLRIAYCALHGAGGAAPNSSIWRFAGWLIRPLPHSPTQPTSGSPGLVVSFLLSFLLLFEHLSLSLPLSDLRVPALYERVAATPGDFALLELPPGWRNGARVAGKQDVVIMQQLWSQTTHGKRLLGGNTSRNPEFKFQFFSEDATLARLIGATNAADAPQHEALRAQLAANPISPAEAARARAWAATWNIRQVMVHRDKLSSATEEALRQLLPVQLIGESGALALYQVEPSPLPSRFAVGTDDGSLVLAEGWSRPVWARPNRAQPSWRSGRACACCCRSARRHARCGCG